MIKIYKWNNTSSEEKEKILKRAQLNMDGIKPVANAWIERVRNEGDKAVLEYIREFDDPKFELSSLRVSEKDIAEAYDNVPWQTVQIIKQQIALSRKAHLPQKDTEMALQENLQGVTVGKRITPICAVGMYVPAGLAPLPTVMQILAVPAKIADVPRLIACFPPRAKNYELIVTADLAGVDEVYRVGGIAAIAAMAYGTETIKPVYKIVGPGNVYVQAAKLAVFGQVAIDMPAGPSEAVILADARANPEYAAADILARAEHDPNAAGVLITYSLELAEKTKNSIEKQFETLQRKEIIKESLARYSAIIVVDSFDEAVELTNEYSPEHLEVQIENPWDALPRIKNAGSIFLGDYAPVAVGDYASGANHVLPTGRWPKMFSPVSVRTFQKESEIQYLTKQGLKNLSPIIKTITKIEGLDAHWNSVKCRMH